MQTIKLFVCRDARSKTVTAAVICILFAASFSYSIYSIATLDSFDDQSIQKREIYIIDQTLNLSMLSLTQQREIMPPKCENSTHKMLNIIPVHHNWAPYYFRCNFKQRKKYKAPLGEGFFSKELTYLHVYKAGGTTIQQGLMRLLTSNKLITLTSYNISMSNRYIYLGGGKGLSIEQFLSFIDDKTVIFSFVRDPIDKFLSAFYEANRRGIYKKYNKKTGINTMRAWLQDMLLLPKNNTNLKSQYINFHALPNVFILKKLVPFQFIGDLYHSQEDIPQILNSFIVDDEFLSNSSFLLNNVLKRSRNRRDNYVTHQTKKFNIDRAELTDNDIENICKIYWIDYICFPFDIPKQCDISYLFEQHYNKDVHYDSCY